jgi:hypothetical protein
MIIQLHITDNDISGFFRKLGIETKMQEVIEYRSAYHNKLVEHPRDIPVIEMNGNRHSAYAIYEAYIKRRLLTPGTDDYTLIRELSANCNLQ